MARLEQQEKSCLPPRLNPDCRQPHIVRNGSHRGRHRYHYRTCGTQALYAQLTGSAFP